jgi:hypothetical protein
MTASEVDPASTMQADKDILDFIVIGAPKAGTTSLFQYLKHHPEVSLPSGKEEQFFSHDAVYARGWGAYMTDLVSHRFQGPTLDPMRKWGTVTPQYMVGGVFRSGARAAVKDDYDERTVPLRIHEQLPDVRLVACLRDPVERALSHHRMMVMVGRERHSFDEAVEELLRPQALERARRDPEENRKSRGYIAWSEYGRILAGYFQVFAPEQILVVYNDELARAPMQLLARVEEFIGVSSDFQPENLHKRFRVGHVERGFSWSSPSSWMSPSSPVSPQGVRRALAGNAVTRSAWHAIPPASRRRLARPYEQLTVRVVKWNRRQAPNEIKANAKPSAETLARLREHYREDTLRLASLIGEAPPWQ